MDDEEQNKNWRKALIRAISPVPEEVQPSNDFIEGTRRLLLAQSLPISLTAHRQKSNGQQTKKGRRRRAA